MTVTSERVAYLLLIDGVSTAFADDEAVALAYVQTLGEFTAMHYGLQRSPKGRRSGGRPIRSSLRWPGRRR